MAGSYSKELITVNEKKIKTKLREVACEIMAWLSKVGSGRIHGMSLLFQLNLCHSFQQMYISDQFWTVLKI